MKKRLLIVAALIVIAVTVVGVPTPRLILYRDASVIRSRLIEETPLGSSLDDVSGCLRRMGFTPHPPTRAPFPSNSAYPPSVTGGAAFLHECIGEYRLVFVTSVEAFFVFDAADRLVDIQVRKSVDAL